MDTWVQDSVRHSTIVNGVDVVVGGILHPPRCASEGGRDRVGLVRVDVVGDGTVAERLSEGDDLPVARLGWVVSILLGLAPKTERFSSPYHQSLGYAGSQEHFALPHLRVERAIHKFHHPKSWDVVEVGSTSSKRMCIDGGHFFCWGT